MKTVFIPYEKVLDYFGMESRAEYDWLQDYAADATQTFMMNEWEVGHGEGRAHPDWDAVEEAVRDEIWKNVSRSAAVREVEGFSDAVENILDRAGERARTRARTPEGRGRWGVEVELTDKFPGVYRQAVEGFGLPAERPRAVTPGMVLTAVKIIPEVYGGVRDFKRQVADSFDNWEPNIGTGWELRKVAEKASRKRGR